MAEIKIRFARKAQPKYWKDDLGHRHTSWGDVVVTCSEHGEVGRFLQTGLLQETYPESNSPARLARERHEREQHTPTEPTTFEPDVSVSDAPGYTDFNGKALLYPAADWPVRKVVVGFEVDGRRDVAVVPEECVKPLNGEA